MTAAAAVLLLVGSIVVFLRQAPGSYQIFKTLHAAAAVIRVGGGASLTVTEPWPGRTRTAGR